MLLGGSCSCDIEVKSKVYPGSAGTVSLAGFCALCMEGACAALLH